ncbi:MAG: hypothetical protein ACP5M4_00470 [Acidobacteriaceae bacterium]
MASDWLLKDNHINGTLPMAPYWNASHAVQGMSLIPSESWLQAGEHEAQMTLFLQLFHLRLDRWKRSIQA